MNATTAGDGTGAQGNRRGHSLDPDAHRVRAHGAPTLGQAAAALGLTVLVVLLAAGVVYASAVLFLPSFSVLGLTLALVWGIGAGSLAALVLLRRNRGLTWQALGFRRPTRRLFHLLWQLPLTVIAATAVQGLAMTFVFSSAASEAEGATDGAVADAAAEFSGLGLAILLLALWAGSALLTPLWEEILFRGFVLQALRARWGWLVSVLVTTAVFALAHGLPQMMPYVFVLGLSCALLVRFHGNLWAPLVVHAANNSLVSLIAVSILL